MSRENSCFMYPNAYNIVSYCLGHQEFVTNIEIIDNILISASGDGTLRFWNYLEGKQLFIVNTNDHVSDKSIINNFRNTMDNEKVDVESLSIIDMQIYSGAKKVIAVTLFNLNNVQLYYMENQSAGIEVHFSQTIDVNGQIIGFSLCKQLCILCKDNIVLYNMDENGTYTELFLGDIDSFYNKHKTLFNSSLLVDDISTLYKRKFDNVQEYLERKRLRLEN